MRIKKKVVLKLAMILAAIMLCSCSSGDDAGRRLSKDVFSEDYKNSEGFKIIQDDVISFYNIVESAYNKSDKKNFSSFTIDEDEFGRLYENITDVVDNYDRKKDDITIMLKTAVHASIINEKIAGKNLLEAIGSTGSQQWFEEMDQVLQEAYEDFKESSVPGNGTKSEENADVSGIDSTEIEKMLRGTWEYYDETHDFGERFVFDNGKLEYTAFGKKHPENDIIINGRYRITEENIITTLDNHDEYFDYELKEGNIIFSIDYGDKHGERKYVKK